MSKVRNKKNGDLIDAMYFKTSKFIAQNAIDDRLKVKFMYDKSTTTVQDNTGFEYNMNHKHRGVALIFNHFEYNSSKLNQRHGTEKDVEALLDCLPLLGFESENIIVENDLAKSQILTYSYRLGAAKEEILENCDCIAIFVLSHSSYGNKIYARDDDYDLFQLVEQFAPPNFKELIAKPKLFFINGCGTGSSSSLIYREQSYTHPIFPDILISLSSHPELVSFRDSQYGSWYIQDLCKSIKWFKHQNQLDKVDITAILLFTNFLVSKRTPCTEKELLDNKSMRQVPCFTSTLCRQLYFKAQK